MGKCLKLRVKVISVAAHGPRAFIHFSFSQFQHKMSEDEYSDLTDLDSDEHDEYKITHALSIPRPATFTTQALFGGCGTAVLLKTRYVQLHADQIHNNDINLEPEYQRGTEEGGPSIQPDTSSQMSYGPRQNKLDSSTPYIAISTSHQSFSPYK